VSEPIRLTIAPNELAAGAIVALLETEGIASIQRKTDFAVGVTDASTSSFGPREILVNPEDLDRARDLIATD
jgi:putative signal transducing protein